MSRPTNIDLAAKARAAAQALLDEAKELEARATAPRPQITVYHGGDPTLLQEVVAAFPAVHVTTGTANHAESIRRCLRAGIASVSNNAKEMAEVKLERDNLQREVAVLRDAAFTAKRALSAAEDPIEWTLSGRVPGGDNTQLSGRSKGDK